MFPVFLNGMGRLVGPGSTVGDLIAEFEPGLLPALLDGTAVLTDGRAIPIRSDAPLYPGAIVMIRRSARATADNSHA